MAQILQVAHDLWISTGEGIIVFSSNGYSTSEEFHIWSVCLFGMPLVFTDEDISSVDVAISVLIT